MSRMNREERINTYGSENFTQDPDIAADGHYTFSPAAQERVAKYMPLDEITVQNNSNSNLALLLNGSQSRKYIVKAGTIRSFDSSDIKPFRTYKLEELSGAEISEGSVTVDVRRSGMDADKAAKQRSEQSAASKFVENTIGVKPEEVLGNGRR